MKAPSHLRSGEFGFNMTPMIDIVFLLIIFFLVSSHLAKREKQIEMSLPESASGEKSLVDAPEVVIQIQADGSLWFGGEQVSKEQLSALVEAKMSQADDSTQIAIRGDRKAPYGAIDPVLLLCRELGYGGRVSFKTIRND